MHEPEIVYYNCDDCQLSELNTEEAERHEKLTDHAIAPVYD